VVKTCSSIFWVITRRKGFETDVSGLYIGAIFKAQAVQIFPFKLGTLGSPETSVSKPLSLVIIQNTKPFIYFIPLCVNFLTFKFNTGEARL
jgi:hypothetical protein